MKYKRIVIKIGSNVITHTNGSLDIPRIADLVQQIAALHREGMQVIVVSSGAVASGREELKALTHRLDTVSTRQLYSAVGQAKLINLYYQLFADQNIYCGQVLTTKENFATRIHYLNQRNCIQVMLDCDVIPIINENDTISVTELMFTDNDELSGLVTTMMDADVLIVLSNVDGVYNGNPTDDHTILIPKIFPNTHLSSYIQTTRSQFGRGGMLTKSRIAQKLAKEGVEVIIANGMKDHILRDLIHQENTPCTRFVADEKSISRVKKWIAHSEGFEKGEIHINQGAYEALLAEKANSLLPVGITQIKGDFEKDDIVKIVAPDGSIIGLGKVSTDSKKASTMIGKKGNKPFIHYDYLYLL